MAAIKYTYLLLLLCTCLIANAQEELENHFSKHSINLEGLNEPIDFDLEGSILTNTLLFAQGEVHGVTMYERIKLGLFKYLYKKAGIRVYIVELGTSHAFLFNQFLLTGNQDLISGFNESETQFWIELKRFNDNNEEKIEVIGIDFERSSAIKKTFEIILDPYLPNEIDHNIRELKSAFESMPDPKTRDAIIEEMRQHINENEAVYKEYLGGNFDTFHSIIFNESPVTGTTKRDKYMIANLKKYHERNPGSRYFGVFGISHTNRNNNTLIGMLSKDEKLPFYKSVTVFSPQYMNCETNYGSKTLTVDDYGLLTQEKIKKRRDILSKLENDLLFIDLKGLDFKYKRLTAASDFLIVLRNQKNEQE